MERIGMLLQELSGKDQEKVAEVSRVRVELQEQIGHLHAERTAQGGLKEKISALEREIKGAPLFFCLLFSHLFIQVFLCFRICKRKYILPSYILFYMPISRPSAANQVSDADSSVS